MRMIDGRLMERLRAVTAEEQAFLDGSTTIQRELYMASAKNTVNAAKLLAAGKRITVRPNTRFIDFPEHTHDYVEMVYMLSGSTTHVVQGRRLVLGQGELLLLGQQVTHRVMRSGREDVGVNFIVLPDFFATTLNVLGQEETPLRRFLISCLCGGVGAGYLHFSVSGVPAVENLVENLLFALTEETPNRRKTGELTMALLFLQLMGHTDALQSGTPEDTAVFQVLQYVEEEYARASFSQVCGMLHYDPSWLSRKIKKETGRTFTELVREKRLAQAAFLLKNTRLRVSDVAMAVGYENVSFFHRIFLQTYGKNPKAFRDATKDTFFVN